MCETAQRSLINAERQLRAAGLTGAADSLLRAGPPIEHIMQDPGGVPNDEAATACDLVYAAERELGIDHSYEDLRIARNNVHDVCVRVCLRTGNPHNTHEVKAILNRAFARDIEFHDSDERTHLRSRLFSSIYHIFGERPDHRPRRRKRSRQRSPSRSPSRQRRPSRSPSQQRRPSRSPSRSPSRERPELRDDYLLVLLDEVEVPEEEKEDAQSDVHVRPLPHGWTEQTYHLLSSSCSWCGLQVSFPRGAHGAMDDQTGMFYCTDCWQQWKRGSQAHEQMGSSGAQFEIGDSGGSSSSQAHHIYRI